MTDYLFLVVDESVGQYKGIGWCTRVTDYFCLMVDEFGRLCCDRGSSGIQGVIGGIGFRT